MNVLSLFDGMSCGQIALGKLGIKIDNYYASEIDSDAIRTTKHNFPNTIHLGDVRNIKACDLPKIDLLIGGSPCQGFSFSGKQLNFEDPRSVLFFEFDRLLKECQPKYFLLENVLMNQKSSDVITEYLGVQPVLIDSASFSAQSRKRIYWTNIKIEPFEDKNIFLKDVLRENEILVHNIYGGFKETFCRVYEHKSPTLRANSGGGSLPSVFKGTKEEAQSLSFPELRRRIRSLSVEEAKALQTIPYSYDLACSRTQAYKMLGNGWTVDVVAHILSGIKKF